MKSDLIDTNQLEDVLKLITPTTEEYAEALQKTMQIALEQPLISYTDPSELLVKDSGTIHADMPSQTIIALQCKSCGGFIDKDTMTCRHCGMTYMLVNKSEINPRHIYPDF